MKPCGHISAGGWHDKGQLGYLHVACFAIWCGVQSSVSHHSPGPIPAIDYSMYDAVYLQLAKNMTIEQVLKHS